MMAHTLQSAPSGCLAAFLQNPLDASALLLNSRIALSVAYVHHFCRTKASSSPRLGRRLKLVNGDEPPVRPLIPKLSLVQNMAARKALLLQRCIVLPIWIRWCNKRILVPSPYAPRLSTCVANPRIFLPLAGTSSPALPIMLSVMLALYPLHGALQCLGVSCCLLCDHFSPAILPSLSYNGGVRAGKVRVLSRLSSPKCSVYVPLESASVLPGVSNSGLAFTSCQTKS